MHQLEDGEQTEIPNLLKEMVKSLPLKLALVQRIQDLLQKHVEIGVH